VVGGAVVFGLVVAGVLDRSTNHPAVVPESSVIAYQEGPPPTPRPPFTSTTSTAPNAVPPRPPVGTGTLHVDIAVRTGDVPAETGVGIFGIAGREIYAVHVRGDWPGLVVVPAKSVIYTDGTLLIHGKQYPVKAKTNSAERFVSWSDNSQTVLSQGWDWWYVPPNDNDFYGQAMAKAWARQLTSQGFPTVAEKVP
jgi:hypothetical protein